jgi:hypothetical protein
MGAASREQLADSQTGTIDGATISSLRSSMAVGNIVTASNINTLIGMFNTMVGHYHTYTDRYQQATYGNNGTREVLQEAKNTGVPIDTSSGSTIQSLYAPFSAIDTSTIITAAKHNQLANTSRALQNHLHQIDDRTA